jgi:FADH2-dependent halogenase/halogenation protein CepH
MTSTAAPTTATSQDVFDVIVIGAGPGGTSAAYTLAGRGHSVLLLEKEEPPRFHIGESLLPYGTGLFARMGILDAIETGSFVVKPGAEVAEVDGGSYKAVFAGLPAWQKNYAFQVERSKFDHLLVQLAQGSSVQVLQQAEVEELIFDGERIVGVVYRHQERSVEARARFVVDASGRGGVIARHFKLRKMNRRLNNVAVFQHFRHVTKGMNSSDDGYILVTSHEDGWLWCIPIGPDTLSVGAVMSAELLKNGDRAELFRQHVGRAPNIAASIETATPVFDLLKVESDFCYHSEQLAGPGFFLVGDAGCFVDPLFSGGALLAMVGGVKAAEAIDGVFGGADELAARTDYENLCKTGYDAYFRLCYYFYDNCEGKILSIFNTMPCGFKPIVRFVAGDFWGSKDNPVLHYLRSQSSLDTFEAPFEYVYECPVYPQASAVEDLAEAH